MLIKNTSQDLVPPAAVTNRAYIITCWSIVHLTSEFCYKMIYKHFALNINAKSPWISTLQAFNRQNCFCYLGSLLCIRYFQFLLLNEVGYHIIWTHNEYIFHSVWTDILQAKTQKSKCRVKLRPRGHFGSLFKQLLQLK